MEVNPAPPPRPSATGQPSASPAGSPGATASAPDHGPALRLDSAQTAPVEVSQGQAGGQEVRASNPEDLKKAETLRALIGNKNMQLKTYHDDASGRSVLEVSDQATGKVVSQYPSDELLRLYAALREPLFDQSA